MRSETATSVGIYIFPNAEVLDFAGPYEVFTTASRVARRAHPSLPEPFTVFTIAREPGTVGARAGLTVLPDYTFADHPPIDLLLVPGGVVTEELREPAVTVWVAGTSAKATLTASVCTGSFLLPQAGLLDHRSATTHWEDVAEMRARFPAVDTLEQRRWVDEG